jgi:multiple sugar transport system ATP-binding protein
MKPKEDGSVKISNLVKTYTDDRGRPTFTAVKNINLEIKDGEFMVLVGPSGCGKSTTLRMVAGLEKISSGTIAIGGKVVNDLEPKDRGISMVFQSYALYPHMNLFNNMAFGLKLASPGSLFRRLWAGPRRRWDWIMLERKPGGVIGRQRRRVAWAGRLCAINGVFCLTSRCRIWTRRCGCRCVRRFRGCMRVGSTMIYVTHDQVEAMTMGDRICVMRDGLIMQVADPLTLFRQPENMFVAGFIGSPPMNLIKGKIQKRDGGLVFVETADSNPLTLPLSGAIEALGAKYVDKEVVFGIRPEQITNEPRSDIATTPVTLKVEIAEPMGAESLVYLKTGAGSIIARIQGDHIFIWVRMLSPTHMDRTTLFDPKPNRCHIVVPSECSSP